MLDEYTENDFNTAAEGGRSMINTTNNNYYFNIYKILLEQFKLRSFFMIEFFLFLRISQLSL